MRPPNSKTLGVGPDVDLTVVYCAAKYKEKFDGKELLPTPEFDKKKEKP